MAKSKFGYMKCPDCAVRVVVKVNEKETLSYTCDECDSRGYAQKGAGNYKTWIARIERAPGSAPAAGDKKPADDKKPDESKPEDRKSVV